MTHYTVGIIIPPDMNDEEIERFADRQMEAFDENAEREPYVCYTLENAATELAESINRYRLILKRQDPAYRLDECQRRLTELSAMTPAAVYAERSQGFETFNEQGEPLSTANPDAKWDWYCIGGRWDGWINGEAAKGQSTLDNNLATVEAVLESGRIPHALVTPAGEWHEKGKLGWWATLLTENEHWETDAKAILADHLGHRLLIIDAHI